MAEIRGDTDTLDDPIPDTSPDDADIVPPPLPDNLSNDDAFVYALRDLTVPKYVHSVFFVVLLAQRFQGTLANAQACSQLA